MSSPIVQSTRVALFMEISVNIFYNKGKAQLLLRQPWKNLSKLYLYLVLSGGSTMFKDFGRRLQRDVNKLINNRIKLSEELSGGKMKAKEMKVEVEALIFESCVK